ncbi:hypothetical protein ACQKPC_01915 [Pseudomonas sp. NPDC089918]|uniref:hypothetical protein n=1 Tax=Pseudomonas sp. NPDC089918 TaxID=3390654 RepID=UPI003CFC9D08
MNERAINTNTNLVLNGDFQEDYEHWIDLFNPLGVSVSTGQWGGESIKFMSLTNLASVYQTLEIPADGGASARYHMSVLYETVHTEPGTIKIGKEDSTQELELLLPPAGSPQDTVNRLDLNLIELTTYLDFDIRQGDRLRVTLISPSSLGSQQIRLARIRLHLELDPLQLLQWHIDGQHFTAGQTMYLCLGAAGAFSHELGVVPDEESPWLDTEAALWSEDNPLEAITTLPALGENQRIELPWTIDCPDLEGDEARLLTLELYSKYTAPPFPIAVSLGHHRLVMEVVQEAAYFPVIEYEESVELVVLVRSHYTQAPVSGQEVIWRLGDEVLQRGTTDGEGKARFDYRPATAGVQDIEASVASPYYESGQVVQSLQVRALASDPWKSVGVSFNNTNIATWGEKTGYPDRGGDYRLGAGFSSNSPLQGTEVWLLWEGEPHAELAVTVSPDLAVPVGVPVGGEQWLDWVLHCGDIKDGRFGLRLGCSRLLRTTVPNAMSLARNSVKIGEVREANKSPVVDEGDDVYCMLQVLSLNNQPVLNARVDWVGPRGTVTSYTGEGGWASVIDKPTEPGGYSLTAQVKVRDDGSTLDREFQVLALASSQWKDEVTFFLDGRDVIPAGLNFKPGVVCLRGRSHVLRLEPSPGSAFIGQRIALNGHGGVHPGLGLVFTPDLGGERVLTDEGLEWEISSGSDISGLFGLEVHSNHLPEKRELNGRLFASSLAQEATLVLDQTPAVPDRGAVYPCIGAIHNITLWTPAFSPLHGLRIGWGGVPPDWIITPPINQPPSITAGGGRFQFDLSATQQGGDFRVFFGFNYLPLDWSTIDFPFKLAHNKLKVGAIHNAATDPVLSKNESARLEIQYLSFFTDQPVEGASVQWQEGLGQPGTSLTGPEGWAGYACRPQAAGPNQVTARVDNPYDGTQAGETFEVNALETDPWLDLMVHTDDQLPQPWAQSTFFPRRDSEFNFLLSANEDSVLYGQTLTLGLTGTGPAELALEPGPVALGVPRQLTAAGLPFTLKAGDIKDAGFSLRLAASRLLERSPLHAVSLGTTSQVIKFKAMDSILQVIDWGTEFKARVTLVSVITGKPLAGVSVVWESQGLEPIRTTTNFHGVATVSFVPVKSGLMALTATAGDAVHSDSITINFTVNEPRRIQDISSPELSGYPGDEVSAQVTVVSLSGKALEGVEVMWRFEGVSLEPTLTGADGKANVHFKLPVAVGERSLIASVRGGETGWDSARLVFTVVEDEPVLEDITTDTPTIRLGDNVIAWVKVVGRNGGVGMENVEVAWRFPDQVLLPSSSDKNGIARVMFKPDKLGVYDLTATLESSNPSSVARITIMEAWHVEITRVWSLGGNFYPIGGYATVRAIVVSRLTQQPAQGVEVFWFRNENQAPPATHTDSDGLASKNFGPLPAGGTRIRAQVRDPQGTVLSEKYYDLTAMNRPWPVNQ